MFLPLLEDRHEEHNPIDLPGSLKGFWCHQTKICSGYLAFWNCPEHPYPSNKEDFTWDMGGDYWTAKMQSRWVPHSEQKAGATLSATVREIHLTQIFPAY